MFSKYRGSIVIAVAAVIVGLVLVRAGLAGKPVKPSPAPPVITFLEVKFGGWMSGDEVTFVKTVDESGNESTVTSSPGYLPGNAAWSPNGLHIGGYRKWNPGATSGFDQSLMSIRSDGTDEQVVVSYEEVEALNILNGRPSSDECGMEHGLPFLTADWSPDGRYMVFSAATFYRAVTRTTENEFHLLYVVDLWKPPFERVTQLTSPQGLKYGQKGDRYPRWSWSLNKILFSSSRERNDTGADFEMSHWIINPDGTGLRKLMDHDQYGDLSHTYSAWTRSGMPDPDNPDGGASQLCINMNGVGNVLIDVDLSQADPIGNITPLINATGLVGGFSPDDTGLAVWRYVDKGGGTSQIVLLDLLTGGEEVIVNRKGGGSGLCQPDWNPLLPMP